ncbi:hypothetical protein CSC94_20735 [Zhengella mangrovi]|uniref:DUF3750 domain-containing protein n=1 Tax=Zhengella mangrovi TaxID=1982044 RepID=A0A2G1QIZ1_9HYPH|nr:DUF3750 domain-containing protein [Zhengella mangrovi]PHP65178.1 hypothetical protein CSC94_20735 [Zhengella mangrovi]
MKSIKRLAALFAILFLLPSLASAAWWVTTERPGSWRQADWSASGVLPPAASLKEPVIHIMAARTGGLKGALAVHSWIVTYDPTDGHYNRYDKVGWGLPVRRNAYPADGRWYSNTPFIVKTVRGAEAARLIPKVEAAIAAYPYNFRGGYTIWPGPNSNSFVAFVLRRVPDLGAVLPANAVGRDWRPGFISFDHAPGWTDVHVSLGGVIGLAAGLNSGLEIQVLGLVAGVDVMRPGLKIPAIGRVGL